MPSGWMVAEYFNLFYGQISRLYVVTYIYLAAHSCVFNAKLVIKIVCLL